MSTEELMVKMYEEIKEIREDLEEIKVALIPEDEPTEEELMEIELGNREIAEGKYRSWKSIILKYLFCQSRQEKKHIREMMAAVSRATTGVVRI